MIPGLATCSSFSSSCSSSCSSSFSYSIDEEDQPNLYSYTDSQQWSKTIDRIATHPEEARYQDMFQDTALHRACTSDPPVEVIDAFLTAYPAATSIQDSSGWTPLHCACVFGASIEVVSRLIQANVSAIHMKNLNMHTPLQQLCHEFFQMVHQQTTMCDGNKIPLLNQNPYDPTNQKDYLISFWNNANLLVKAANHGTTQYNGHPWRMVHACVEMEDCPAELALLAIQYHPEQLEEKDERGKLPLHIAVSKIRKNNNDKLFQAILQASPSAVTIKEEQTHLYPFMLEAVREESSLTPLYQMLRSCPELERYTGPKRSKFL